MARIVGFSADYPVRWVARSRIGQPLAHVGVNVTWTDTEEIAPVYSDAELRTVVPSPVTDVNGVFSYYLEEGTYSFTLDTTERYEPIEDIEVVGAPTSNFETVRLSYILPRGVTDYPTQDGASLLQEKLDEMAAEHGGGAVIDDRGGYYRLESAVDVPRVVALRGIGRPSTLFGGFDPDARIVIGDTLEGGRRPPSGGFTFNGQSTVANGGVLFGYGSGMAHYDIEVRECAGIGVKLQGAQNGALTGVISAENEINWWLGQGIGNVLLSSCVSRSHLGDYGVVFADDTPSFSRNDATDVLTITMPDGSNHGWLAGREVQLNKIVSVHPRSQTFFVVNPTATTIQIALTEGGSPVDILDGGRGKIWPVDQPELAFGASKKNHEKVYWHGGLIEGDLEGDALASVFIQCGRRLVFQTAINAYNPDGVALWVQPVADSAAQLDRIILHAGQLSSVDGPNLRLEGRTTGTRVLISGGWEFRGVTEGAIEIDDNGIIVMDHDVQILGTTELLPYTGLGTKQTGRLVRLNNEQRVYKLADEVINDRSGSSPASFVDDADLVVDVQAYMEYEIECYLVVTGPGDPTGDIAYRFNLPAGADYRLQAIGPPSNVTGVNSNMTAVENRHGASITLGTLPSTVFVHRLVGTLTTDEDGGEAQLRWAQATATVGDTTLYGGDPETGDQASWMSLKPVRRLRSRIDEEPEEPEEEE